MEMAVVVIISGIILAFLGAALIAFLEESQTRTTEHRLQQIGEAVDRYLSVNGRYPCPASRFLGGGNANYGRDTCTTGTLAGTTRTGNLHIGAVPTRTLNLPDEYLADAWGRKYTYAVSRDLTSAATYRADLGIIRVLGVSGTVLTDDGHYAVVSHGASGHGGFYIGSSNSPYVPCSPSSIDRENCDDDRVFVSRLVNSELNEANFYDDYVYYKGLKAPLTYPAGAVMAFNMASCPDGWVGFASAEGRFVVGALDDPVAGSIISFDQEIIRLHATNPSEVMDFTAGTVTNSTNINIQTNMPPYVALRYCEKLPR